MEQNLGEPLSRCELALACGFVSASHFSKCYRDFFGKTPRKERNMPPLPVAPAAEALHPLGV